MRKQHVDGLVKTLNKGRKQAREATDKSARTFCDAMMQHGEQGGEEMTPRMVQLMGDYQYALGHEQATDVIQKKLNDYIELDKHGRLLR